jgi:hypothetical protein
MRQLFTFSAFAFFLLFILSSCQKSDVIRDERSLDGIWRVTDIRSDGAYDFDGDGRTETDIYGSYSSCQRDIVIDFSTDGYGRMRQGCNAYWDNITWRLSNGNRQLDIQLPDDQLNLSISQFDNNTIRGVDQVSLDGRNFQITYTLQRQ